MLPTLNICLHMSLFYLSISVCVVCYRAVSVCCGQLASEGKPCQCGLIAAGRITEELLV